MSCETLLPANIMARHLGVKLAWLKEQADQNTIPHLKAGDRYLFNPEAVERVLAERAARIEVTDAR